MDYLAASEALVLMYYASKGEDPSPTWGPPWRSVFADRPGNTRLTSLNWIVSNKTLLPHVMVRTKLHEGRSSFPLFHAPVKEGMELRAKMISQQEGDYYRDLFVHRLPGGGAENYCAVLLDGHLLGIVGAHMQSYRTGSGVLAGTPTSELPAKIVFAFTAPQELEPRLHKLTLMSMCSAWFWEDVFGALGWFQIRGVPEMIQSTMLTPHPENKTARGTGMTMRSRERQSDGEYKLVYEAHVADRTREETLALWYQKFKQRPKQETPKKSRRGRKRRGRKKRKPQTQPA